MSRICGKEAPRGVELGLAGCHVCEKVAPASVEKCPRCGSHLHIRKPDSITRTMALLVAAVIMYIPANMLPVMVGVCIVTGSEPVLVIESSWRMLVPTVTLAPSKRLVGLAAIERVPASLLMLT